MTDDATISAYFDAKSAVHELFGYEPDWVEIPLGDFRWYHWFLTDGEGDGSWCVYSDEAFTEKSIKAGTKIYCGQIYTQRFLPKWVYRTAKHVLVSVNTNVDGNKFLMIFDANKECKNQRIRSLCISEWIR